MGQGGDYCPYNAESMETNRDRIVRRLLRELEPGEMIAFVPLRVPARQT